MSKPYIGENNIGIKGALKHLKTGDIFNIQSGKNTCKSFTVLGADIIHKDQPHIMGADKNISPNIFTLTSNYPFYSSDHQGGNTPLRYVIYAELMQKLPRKCAR